MNDNDAIERLKWHSHFSDGWQSVESSTWTYASASTFTVAGDQTAIFAKGRFLKWTQTTVKYGVVAASSYSSPNTTVTIIVNTDYTMANAAISSPFISYAANPQGWPWGAKRQLNFCTYQALPYNASFAANYQPYNATLPENCLLLDYAINIYIATTNNASNYYIFGLRDVGGTEYTGSPIFNTGASSPNTWLRFSGTLNIEALATTKQMVYWYMTKFGSPGNFYLTAPSVSII